MGIQPLPDEMIAHIIRVKDEQDFTAFVSGMDTKIKENLTEKGLTEEEQTKTVDSLGALLLATWLEARRTLREKNHVELGGLG